jgi:hypothetical protein
MTSITLTETQFAALLAGAPADVPPAPADDTADRAAYATYKARVTRGKARTFAQWMADRTTAPAVAPAVAPATAPAVAPADPDLAAAGRMLRRDGCKAVLRFAGGHLAGIYTYPGKRGTGRCSILADDPDGSVVAELLRSFEDLVIATR